MLLITLLGIGDAAADKVLDRAAAYHRAHPDLSVEFTTELERKSVAGAGGPPGARPGTAMPAPAISPMHAKLDGKMMVEGDERAYVHMWVPDLQYRVVSSPEGIIEVNDTTKTYDEFRGWPTLYFPASRIAPFSQAIPTWLPITDIRRLVPNGTTFKSTGTATYLGKSCDTVHTHFMTPTGVTVDIDAAVDPLGRILDYRTVASSVVKVTTDWRISREDPISNLPLSTFRLPAPTGYIPFALPEHEGLIKVGSPFPVKGWHAPSGNVFNVENRLGAKGGLVVFLGSESEPSERARGSLARLKSSVPVVTLSDTTQASSHVDGYDASGKLLKEVSLKDTPFFVLIGRGGKIVKTWMGYDPDKAATFEKEVRTAYAAK